MLLTTAISFNLSILPRDSSLLVLHQFLLYSERRWRRRQDVPLCSEPAVRKWFCLLTCTGCFMQASCTFLQCTWASAHGRLWRKVRINAVVLLLFLSEWGRKTPSPCAVDSRYEEGPPWVQSHKISHAPSHASNLLQSLKLAAPSQLWLYISLRVRHHYFHAIVQKGPSILWRLLHSC